MAEGDDNLRRTVSGLRFDLVIAVCALLISTLATGAAWWQARVLAAQTRVLQEQLGAQVWPYVNSSEGINGDTVRIDITNNGLGPAVLRSVVASINGVSEPNYIDILHALLGPNLLARKPHGEKLNYGLDTETPGFVMRPGAGIRLFSLESKTYARAFLRAYARVRTKICYCAIIPGKCWLSDSNSGNPQPVPSCHEISNDILHSSAVNEILVPNL
jgi:hypothetical protein